MWWDRFEVRIINTFSVIDKYAGRQVHTDEMKLRLLNLKVKAEFLVAMKMKIETKMNMVSMATTFDPALVNDRNTVNKNYRYSH